MTKELGKNIRRTIKQSFGRFMGILLITMLGVTFFAGLKLTNPVMNRTLERYLAESNLYDFRLLSTIGFEDKDIEALEKLPAVNSIKGSVQADIVVERDEEVLEYRFHMLTEGINTPQIQAGRLPEKDDECLGDSVFFREKDIGKTIKIADSNKDEDLKNFKYREYTITGICASPLYISKIAGTTGLGDGTLDGALYINREGFDVSRYTEIYADLQLDPKLYSDRYEEEIKENEDIIKAEALKAVTERFDDVKEEALDEINKGQEEYDKGLSDFNREKAEGEEELNNALKELEDAEKQIADTEALLSGQKAELDKAYEALDETAKQIAPDAESLDEAYDIGAEEYTRSWNEFVDQVEYAGYEAYYNYSTGAITEREYNALLDEINRTLYEREAAANQTADMLLAYKASVDEYNAGKNAYDEAYEKLENAKRDLEQGRKEYQEGLEEFNEKTADAEAELEEAENKLEEARKEYEDLKDPEVFVLDRNINMGYSSFESDSSVVAKLAGFLPVFFFLIAALVCSTTMTRMVSEERTQMGILGALGYSRNAVISKYLIYAGFAALVGCVGGYFLGGILFPSAIWQAYTMLYNIPGYVQIFDWKLFLISFAVSMACSVLVTYISCKKEMEEVPAELIRPKSPSSGKRIILERFTPFWNKLSFLHKVTLRNIFRFKKRMIMMILGIAGCTALVITAFGLKDSIANLANFQFDDIQVYAIEADYNDEVSKEDMDGISQMVGEDLAGYAKAFKESAEVTVEGTTKNIFLIATDDAGISHMIDLHDGEREIKYPGDGEAVLSKKAAKLFGIKKGETVTFTFSQKDSISLKVTDLCDNYVYNYMYINDESLKELRGEYKPKTLYMDLNDGADVYKTGAEIANLKGVSRVVINQEIKDMVDRMMMSMNFVIGLVLFCAAALAFIVLFNLGNINITERVREIATLKVVGFRKGETGSYVFRENIILTIIGIVLGLGAGKLLHSYVMSQITVEMVSFNVVVKPLSYLMGALLVLLFAIITDLVLRKKINRINMAESLKSVE